MIGAPHAMELHSNQRPNGMNILLQCNCTSRLKTIPKAKCHQNGKGAYIRTYILVPTYIHRHTHTKKNTHAFAHKHTLMAVIDVQSYYKVEYKRQKDLRAPTRKTVRKPAKKAVHHVTFSLLHPRRVRSPLPRTRADSSGGKKEKPLAIALELHNDLLLHQGSAAALPGLGHRRKVTTPFHLGSIYIYALGLPSIMSK